MFVVVVKIGTYFTAQLARYIALYFQKYEHSKDQSLTPDVTPARSDVARGAARDLASAAPPTATQPSRCATVRASTAIICLMVNCLLVCNIFLQCLGGTFCPGT